MLHKSNFSIETAVANCSGAMEADTISKNGRSLKSQTSKGNKCAFLFFLCLFFFGIFFVQAQESKLKIAVIDLDYPSSAYASSSVDYYNNAKRLTSILTTELVSMRKYVVMERSRIDQVMKELGLQSTQNASARAAEIGNLLGVHKIITGEYISSNSVSLRLIDIESGGIEAAITLDTYVRDKKGKIKKSKGWSVRISDEEFAKKLLNALLN